MNDVSFNDVSCDEKLDRILAEYVVSEESGQPINRQQLLDDHPEYALRLREFFADRDRFKQFARPLKTNVLGRTELPATIKYFGDYELLEVIAAGGMGVVYKARQTTLNRIVAIKMVLAGQLASESDIQRFVEEAATAARLKHRGIVPIHEVGQHNGQHYFSMDLIEGENLADRYRDQRASHAEAAQLVKSIAGILSYAHGQGTIHRDIKPSNILVDSDDQVHITDFGLATRVEGDHELTRTGQVLGTPSYMAPEQATARHQLVGPASDIYSLGAILYELLTGRPPFRAETAVETIQQVIGCEPVSPRRLDPSVPMDLATICLKCLQKEPRQRYASADLLADDLGRFLADEPIIARPIGRMERAWRWCRRESRVAGLIAAIALSLLIGSCVSTYFAFQANQTALAEKAQRDRAERGEQQARTTLKKNALLSLSVQQLEQTKSAIEKTLVNKQRRLYGTLIELARAEAEGGDTVRANRYLDECPPELRQRDWRELKHRVYPQMMAFDGQHCVAFSADGQWIAAASHGNAIGVWSFADQQLRFTLKGHSDRPNAITFSPDSKRLVSVGRDRKIMIWDMAEAGRLIHELNGHAEEISDVAFSSDARYLVTASQGLKRSSKDLYGSVRVWDSQTWEQLEQLDGYGCARFSPDGQFIVYRSARPGPSTQKRSQLAVVKLWDRVTGTAVKDQDGREIEIPTSGVAEVKLSRDGSRLAVAQQSAVVIWDLNRQLIEQQVVTFGSITGLEFSPDGTRLVCTVRGYESVENQVESRLEIWNLMSGEKERNLPWFTNPITDVAVNDEGRYVATAGGSAIKIWDVSRRDDPTEMILADVRRKQVGAFDWPEWGGSGSRMNTPAGRNIPLWWKPGQNRWRPRSLYGPATAPPDSTNIKWAVALGSQTYGNPVVANSQIYVGSNNAAGYLERYPAAQDLGVLLCFDERSGAFKWQHSNEKLPTGRVQDWPQQGVCSTPVIDGNRLWYVSNRCEVVCLDTEGFYDGEDDGAEKGVWQQVFNVSRSESSSFGSWRISDSLKAGFEKAGVEWNPSWHIRQTADERQWQVGQTQRNRDSQWEWIAHYDITSENGQLAIAKHRAQPAGKNEALFRIQDDFYPSLLQQKLSPKLIAVFKQHGCTVDPQIPITFSPSQPTWQFPVQHDGQTKHCRLELDGNRVIASVAVEGDLRYEADVVWRFDMISELGVFPHNMSNCSMISVDGKLFVCTSNGVDESHVRLSTPDAPSFIAMDRETGKVLWTDNSPGANILHAQWASPAYGVFDGLPQVIFPGGDGWVYSFDPRGDGKGGSKLLWKFDGNAKGSKWILGGRGTRNNIIAFPAIYDGLVYIVMGQDPEHGEGDGCLWCLDPARHTNGEDVSAELAVDANGKILRHRRLQAVDVERGERAVENPNSAVVWKYTYEDQNADGKIAFEERFHRSLSIPVIKDDVLYIGDFSGLFHCLNAKTGRVYWTYDLLAACWGSALLVDGKVYIGDEDGEIAVFRHSANPQIAMDAFQQADGSVEWHPINSAPGSTFGGDVVAMPTSVYMTPIVANNILYIATKNMLYAIAYDKN